MTEARRALASEDGNALVNAGIDPDKLERACASALYYYWQISERIRGEPKALKDADKAANDAQYLADWVSALLEDMPSVFEKPDGGAYSIEAEALVELLIRVRDLAFRRGNIGRNYPDIFGVWPKGSARSWAIRKLSLQIKKLDPNGRPHNRIVANLAEALFGGELANVKMVEKYRTAVDERRDLAIDLGLSPGLPGDV